MHAYMCKYLYAGLIITRRQRVTTFHCLRMNGIINDCFSRLLDFSNQPVQPHFHLMRRL